MGRQAETESQRHWRLLKLHRRHIEFIRRRVHYLERLAVDPTRTDTSFLLREMSALTWALAILEREVNTEDAHMRELEGVNQ